MKGNMDMNITPRDIQSTVLFSNTLRCATMKTQGNIDMKLTPRDMQSTILFSNTIKMCTTMKTQGNMDKEKPRHVLYSVIYMRHFYTFIKRLGRVYYILMYWAYYIVILLCSKSVVWVDFHEFLLRRIVPSQL